MLLCVLLLILYSVQLPGSALSGVLLVALVSVGFLLASVTRALVSQLSMPLPKYVEPLDMSSWSHTDPVSDRVTVVFDALSGHRPHSAIAHAFTSVQDARRLSELKTLVDRRLREGNYVASSLHHLVFSVLSAADKEKLLGHFEATFKASGLSSTSRIVVSDIDDTLAPTFKDRRGYQWGQPYPGVKALYAELAGVAPEDVMDRLVFVTARPGFLASWTRGEMKASGFAASMILFGSATSSATPPRMLARKQKQIRQVRAVWPECELVLVGDNGQMDIDLGTVLLREGVVRSCVIHDIYESSPVKDSPELASSAAMAVRMSSSDEDAEDDDDVEQARRSERLAAARRTSAPAALSSYSDAPPRMLVEHSRPLGFRHDDCKEAGIHLFQTYAGAALACYQLGLVDRNAMRRIVEACSRDLGDVNRRVGSATSTARKLCDATLRDVSRVALMLDDGDKVSFLDTVCSAMR